MCRLCVERDYGDEKSRWLPSVSIAKWSSADISLCDPVERPHNLRKLHMLVCVLIHASLAMGLHVHILIKFMHVIVLVVSNNIVKQQNKKL